MAPFWPIGGKVELNRAEFLQSMATFSVTMSFLGVGALEALGKSQQATAIIPASGEKLPRVGLGTYSTFDVGIASDEITAVQEVLSEFYKLGGRLIDSSPMYHNAETVTGILSADLKINNDLFMATKVWTTGRDAGLSQMQDSLAKLRRKKLELMQIHNLVDWRTQLKTLRGYQEKGIFKYLGLTHYMTSAFPEMEKIVRSEKVDFIQIPYSIAETSAEARLIGAAADRGVAVIANEPFGQGRLFRLTKGKKLPAWALERGIASWGEYFLRFILANPRVQFVIPATRKITHLRDNMRAGLGAPLTAAEREKMQQEFQ
jgi:diketogulonate reductase-like aldo/keto reductase